MEEQIVLTLYNEISGKAPSQRTKRYDATWMELIGCLVDMLNEQGWILNKEIVMEKVEEAAVEQNRKSLYGSRYK